MDPDEVFTKVCSSRLPCTENGALKSQWCLVVPPDADISFQELFL